MLLFSKLHATRVREIGLGGECLSPFLTTGTLFATFQSLSRAPGNIDCEYISSNITRDLSLVSLLILKIISFTPTDNDNFRESHRFLNTAKTVS